MEKNKEKAMDKIKIKKVAKEEENDKNMKRREKEQ